MDRSAQLKRSCFEHEYGKTSLFFPFSIKGASHPDKRQTFGTLFIFQGQIRS